MCNKNNTSTRHTDPAPMNLLVLCYKLFNLIGTNSTEKNRDHYLWLNKRVITVCLPDVDCFTVGFTRSTTLDP